VIDTWESSLAGEECPAVDRANPNESAVAIPVRAGMPVLSPGCSRASNGDVIEEAPASRGWSGAA